MCFSLVLLEPSDGTSVFMHRLEARLGGAPPHLWQADLVHCARSAAEDANTFAQLLRFTTL